ncbi:MAG: hypothetical protein BWY44_00730 [Candidatus Omnitrophica bacterium ADurb.Bin292]|nr:MAG: hypothetical protein BWY44_00730 [Candidatus Omnitrophica bacterium ADurb.Bin292]
MLKTQGAKMLKYPLHLSNAHRLIAFGPETGRHMNSGNIKHSNMLYAYDCEKFFLSGILCQFYCQPVFANFVPKQRDRPTDLIPGTNKRIHRFFGLFYFFGIPKEYPANRFFR